MSYTMGVISEFNAEFREKHNLPQPAIRLEKRTWYNPNYNMRFFMIPALLAVLAMLDTMMMSSLSIARERRKAPSTNCSSPPTVRVKSLRQKPRPTSLWGSSR